MDDEYRVAGRRRWVESPKHPERGPLDQGHGGRRPGTALDALLHVTQLFALAPGIGAALPKPVRPHEVTPGDECQQDPEISEEKLEGSRLVPKLLGADAAQHLMPEDPVGNG